jgi:non-ribosomal peptide synthetase component F
MNVNAADDFALISSYRAALEQRDQTIAAMLAALKAWAKMLDLDMELDDPEIPEFMATEDARLTQYEQAAQLTRAVLAEEGQDVA